MSHNEKNVGGNSWLLLTGIILHTILGGVIVYYSHIEEIILTWACCMGIFAIILIGMELDKKGLHK